MTRKHALCRPAGGEGTGISPKSVPSGAIVPDDRNNCGSLNHHDTTTESLPMPTDAKCGLLVGVGGFVLAVAVMFFQKEPQPAETPAAVVHAPATAAAVKPAVVAAAASQDVPGAGLARPTERVEDT